MLSSPIPRLPTCSGAAAARVALGLSRRPVEILMNPLPDSRLSSNVQFSLVFLGCRVVTYGSHIAILAYTESSLLGRRAHGI
jgi:hypothetical protein